MGERHSACRWAALLRVVHTRRLRVTRRQLRFARSASELTVGISWHRSVSEARGAGSLSPISSCPLPGDARARRLRRRRRRCGRREAGLRSLPRRACRDWRRGEICASVLRYRDARATSASRGSGRIAAGRKGWTPRLLMGLDRPAARGSGGNGGRDHRALQDVAKGVGRVLERWPAEADPHSLRMMSASSAEWSLRPSLRQAWW
jgi:hypothetical protein